MHARANTPTAFEVSPPLPHQQVNLEVDKARQLDYQRWLLLGLVVLAAALFDGSQRHEPRTRGYLLEDVQRARAREDAIGRQLYLEVEMLRAPALIEFLAVNRLHMVPPGRNDAIVLERVVPPPQPPSSVVASR